MSSSKLECKACGDVILEDTDLLKCSGDCMSNFHFLCGGFTEKSFRKLTTEKKKKWLCVACIRSNESAVKTRTMSNADQVSNINPQTLENILQQNRELKSLVSTKFDELTHSIEFNSSIIQDLKKSILDLQATNNNLKLRNDQLTTENAEIKKEVKELKFAVIELKQYSRRNNIEISNLPETENENITQVISKLDELANTTLIDNLIAVHRVPSFNRDKPKPIVLQVKSKDVRDELLKKLKNRKLNASDVNSRFSDNAIYFNEHLTPELKTLFYHARKFKNENNLKFCWIRDGKIFLRKNESSKIYRIKTLEDLNIQFSD